MDAKKYPFRRSQARVGRNDKDGFVHRSWLKNQGYPHDELDGRPVIDICNTWSERTPCNGHFREQAENAAVPAADTRRNRLAQLGGRHIVEMVEQDLKMSRILSRQAFENAIRTNAAIGEPTLT